MPGPLESKSFDFAVRVINLHKHLTLEFREFVLAKQLLRSGTAIGALVRESQQAESRPDFIHKLAIALKEAHETEYWLLLLKKTDYLTAKQAQSILADIRELQKLLTSIMKTTNRTPQKPKRPANPPMD